jgi:hypothetical protein
VAGRRAAARRGLRVRAIVLILLLIVQFFLGMISNLFVSIPDSHPGANPSNYFAGVVKSLGWVITSGLSIWLILHVILGMVLVLGAVEFIIVSVRSHNTTWVWASIAGASFIAGAGFNGASFLAFNRDYSSLIMSGLFALGLASYVLGLYLDGRPS